MTILKSTALTLLLALAGPALGGEAGDAVFAERGPWSLGDQALNWHLTTQGPQAEGFLPIKDGALTLTEISHPSDGRPVLQLTVHGGDIDRRIGPFPVSSGDPALIYFLEQTARDMASLTGGNPHYIRNRLKDALFRGGEIARDGDTATAVFHPFADDPNAARMQGFQSLTLTFVMAADLAAPIRRMSAVAGGSGGSPGYRNELVLQ